MKTRSRRLLLGLLLAAAMFAGARPAFSYLPGLTRPQGGGTPQLDRWDFSAFQVTWRLNPDAGGNIGGDRSVAQVMQAAFQSWNNAPNAQVSVSRGSDTSRTSAGFDGVNLMCFVCSGDFSQQAETLAVTITTMSDRVGEPDGRGGTTRFVGQILDSDILFNPNRDFNTGGAGSGQDMETVAVHEVGHFLGLDHSGVVRALMFPFAPALLRTLSYDDVAGVYVLYPKANPDVAVGAIAGTVRRNGNAVFGAHVFAESTSAARPFGSNIRKTPISILTRPDGSYRIEGLPADSYIVTAEPLDGPANNANVTQYPRAFGRSQVETNFTTRWH